VRVAAVRDDAYDCRVMAKRTSVEASRNAAADASWRSRLSGPWPNRGPPGVSSMIRLWPVQCELASQREPRPRRLSQRTIPIAFHDSNSAAAIEVAHAAVAICNEEVVPAFDTDLGNRSQD